MHRRSQTRETSSLVLIVRKLCAIAFDFAVGRSLPRMLARCDARARRRVTCAWLRPEDVGWETRGA
eukprot:2557975-Rhodomonas_salina.1